MAWGSMKTNSKCDYCKFLCINPTGMDRGTIWYSHFCTVNQLPFDKESVENDVQTEIDRLFLNCKDCVSNCSLFQKAKHLPPELSFWDKISMKMDFNSCSSKQYNFWYKKCRKIIESIKRGR